MTTRRLLRSLILATVSIVIAVILAFAYCFISEETNVFNNVLKAAERGNADSQFKLGEMFFDGDGETFGWLRKQDYSQAVKWLRKAAEQGNSDAQLWLGLMYANGEGVTEDYIEAYKWTILAAEQGDPNAVETRDSLKKKMSPQQIDECRSLLKNSNRCQ